MHLKELFDSIPSYILATAASVASAAVTYLVTRRKTKAETISAELHNVETAIGIYRKLAEDLQLEIRELKLELKLVYEQNEKLFRENKELKKQLDALQKSINELQITNR